MLNLILKHAREFREALEQGRFLPVDNGIIFPDQGVVAQGMYYHRLNGGDWLADANLVPNEGLNHILSVAFGSVSPESAWYLALYGNNVAPSANWTASNFPTTAGEITSTTDGYEGANRPLWNPSNVTSGKIDNFGQEAAYTITTPNSLEIYGAGLLSSQARGSTNGILASASQFTNARTVYNNDTFELGYEIELLG